MTTTDGSAYSVPSDLYGFTDKLTDTEKSLLAKLRTTLEGDVYPYLNDAWNEDRLPEEIIEPLHSLRIIEPQELKDAGEDLRQLFVGFRIFELARCDISVATFFTSQAGLFRTACLVGGDKEQVAELQPKIANYELRGVFALTEAEHGSDIAGGLATTAKQNDDGTWTLNGNKRWIGGAALADVLCVFARDVADGKVKAFLVPREAAGVELRKIERKTSLRIMQNADILLNDVVVEDSTRLRNINSFKDVAACLRRMRADVSWIATGGMAGAYEAAVRYVKEREQFGKPIGSFQLIQEKLARMLANLTSSLALLVRLAELQDQGIYSDENSSLAKMYTAERFRETAAIAREICGGNGITLDTDVARFHADAEAVYSYEGTHEITSLIVGRSITGVSAFV